MVFTTYQDCFVFPEIYTHYKSECIFKIKDESLHLCVVGQRFAEDYLLHYFWIWSGVASSSMTTWRKGSSF